jgi:hypothetical protein
VEWLKVEALSLNSGNAKNKNKKIKKGNNVLLFINAYQKNQKTNVYIYG